MAGKKTPECGESCATGDDAFIQEILLAVVIITVNAVHKLTNKAVEN